MLRKLWDGGGPTSTADDPVTEEPVTEEMEQKNEYGAVAQSDSSVQGE
jgi:hypothetical protein